MKKGIVIIAAFAAILCSCSKSRYNNDPVIIDPVEDSFEFSTANVAYYGDYYGNGGYNYALQLLIVYGGATVYLQFDLNTPATGTPLLLPKGEFYPLASGSTDCNYTFVKGYTDGSGNTYGSFYVEEYSQGNTICEVEDGMVSISYDGKGTYAVDGWVTIDGAVLNFCYSGIPTVYDNTTPAPVPTGEFKGVVAYCQGQDWEGIQAEYCDWDLWFYTDDDNAYTVVEVLSTSASQDGIAPGTYSLDTVISESEMEYTVGPGYAVPYIEDGESYYGTYCCSGGSIVAGATAGTIVIGREGNEYSFEFEFEDEFWNASFSGKYTGKISIGPEACTVGKPARRMVESSRKMKLSRSVSRN